MSSKKSTWLPGPKENPVRVCEVDALEAAITSDKLRDIARNPEVSKATRKRAVEKLVETAAAFCESVESLHRPIVGIEEGKSWAPSAKAKMWAKAAVERQAAKCGGYPVLVRATQPAECERAAGLGR